MSNANKSTQEKDVKKGSTSIGNEKEREIVSKSGKVSHINGTDYVFDSEETRVAVSKDVQPSPGGTKSVSNTSNRTTYNTDNND